jgi:hypothetical protein
MGRVAKIEGRQQLLLTVVEAAAMLGVGRTTATSFGHASPRAPLIYRHATGQRDREIATYLDQAITDSTNQHRRG